MLVGASLATRVLLAHADVTVTLVAVGAGIPALGLAGLPVLLRTDRASAAVARRLRPLAEVLLALDLVAGADRAVLERLAAAAEPVVLPPGRMVIRGGDESDVLWVLRHGELRFTSWLTHPPAVRWRRVMWAN